MDSDDDNFQNPGNSPDMKTEKKKERKRGPAYYNANKEPKLTKSGKPRAPPTQAQLDALNANRGKALEKLTEQRRKKREEKEEVKKIVEEVKLDRAPKVREIDSTVASLKAEMEALKKAFSEKSKPMTEKPLEKPKEEIVKPPPVRKVKKVIYEDEDEDNEEIVEVVQRKTQVRPKPVTGTELLDRLFFQGR